MEGKAAGQALHVGNNDENCSSVSLDSNGTSVFCPVLLDCRNMISDQICSSIQQADVADPVKSGLSEHSEGPCNTITSLSCVLFNSSTSQVSATADQSCGNPDYSTECSGAFGIDELVNLVDDKSLLNVEEGDLTSSANNQMDIALEISRADVMDEIDDNSTQLRFSPPIISPLHLPTASRSNSFAVSSNSEFVLNDFPLGDHLITSPDKTCDVVRSLQDEEAMGSGNPNDGNAAEGVKIAVSSRESGSDETCTSSAGKVLNTEREFMDPSPSSSEDSSMDSGIVSQDDQEQTAATNKDLVDPENSSADSHNRKNRKRTKSNLASSSTSDLPSTPKRKKSLCSKMVTFSGVSVYYFTRRQSFITVPSQGGSTLGMTLTHNHMKQMTLKQHRKSVARRRQQMVKEQSRQQRISMKLRQLKQSYPHFETSHLMAMVVQTEPEEYSSESSSDEEVNSDSDGGDNENDEGYFPQPIPTKKRRLLLRMSGVQKIDSDEKLSNKLTRESREVCGCDCNGICIPSRCICAQAGIPCQVDRESFPCGCFASGCKNENGRVEFDADRVQRHYMKTMTRLRLEEAGRSFSEDDPLMQPPEPRLSPYVSSATDKEEHLTVTDATAQAAETTNDQVVHQHDVNSHSYRQPTVSWSTNADESADSLHPTIPPWYSLDDTGDGGDIFQPSCSLWNGAKLLHVTQQTPTEDGVKLMRVVSADDAAQQPEAHQEKNRPQFIEPQPVDSTLCLTEAPQATFDYLNESASGGSDEKQIGMCSYSSRYGTTKSSTECTLPAGGAEQPLRLEPITSFFHSSVSKPESFRSPGSSPLLTACSSTSSTVAPNSSSGAVNSLFSSDSLQFDASEAKYQHLNAAAQHASAAVVELGQDAIDVIA